MNELRDANRAYGEKLAELGAELPELVVLDADLAACSKTAPFIERFPGRHYNVGIQECNMVGVAAGMAACGKIPFVNSFGMFTAGRAYDQIRNAVVYPGLNVKVVGFYSGLSNGEDGPTHQCVEDLALMRAVPNMVVMCPCDANEAALMTEAAAKHSGPCFIRMGRGPVETVTEFEGYKFEIGKGVVMRPGRDAAIIATGNMVATALKAAALLEAEGLDVRVIDMHTIKPIDRRLVLEAARRGEPFVRVVCGDDELAARLGREDTHRFEPALVLLRRVDVPAVEVPRRLVFLRDELGPRNRRVGRAADVKQQPLLSQRTPALLYVPFRRSPALPRFPAPPRTLRPRARLRAASPRFPPAPRARGAAESSRRR